MRAVITFIFWM